jgi:nitroreductase
MKPITDVHELFRHQRAIRNFTDEDVPDALVNQVLTAAIHGPSGSNTQPWHFIVIRDPRVKNALNNLQLNAGGLVLRTESPDTGHRPVVMTPCESCRADLARSDAPNILAPSRRSLDQRWHKSSLVPRSVAPSSAFSAWEIPRTAYSRCVP